MTEALRILLVEDDAGYAALLQDILRQGASFEPQFAVAPRVADALAHLRGQRFDAVILDLNLPDSQSMDTFSRVSGAAPNIPIIVLTAVDDEAGAAAALRAGAEEFLVKGMVDAGLLPTTVRHAIERHRYREALRITEARYRSVVESSVQGILIHVNGIIRFANHSLAAMMGFERPEELIGESIWKYVAAEDRGMVEQYAAARVRGDHPPSRYDLRVVRRDGEVRWADCLVSIINWDNELTLMAALVDVTDRKLAEQHLRASEERFRLLSDNVKEAFLILEVPGGRTLYLSRAFEEMWGHPVEAAYADPQLWLSAVEAEDRAELTPAFESLLRGEPATSVFRVRRPDRSTIWVRARLFPVREGSGRIFRVVGLAEDITELRQTGEELRQAQKMEAVGRLAGGVAHDFNNLLTVIDGFAALVAEQLGDAHPARRDVQEIQTAAKSAASLTRQLLAFSRRQILQPQVVDLNQVLRRVELLLRRVIGEDIALVMNLSTRISRVNADPGQMEQVFMNLAVNARDAMPAGGKLIIETTDIETDAAYTAQHAEAIPGKHVMIAVSDTGVGMDEATRKRLFEPFFTTKPAGRGTGLGLAMVYGIVKQSQGWISVYSEPGNGTTVRIYLPAIDAAESTAPSSAAEEPVQQRSETVLVIEDQIELRTLIERTLKRHGLTVLTAANGQEALAIAREYQAPIDVLLTDVVLPGASGRAIARRLCAARPMLRVIYMSGYTDDTIVHHGVLEPGLAFIEKPFTASALMRKVGEVIDARRPPPH